MTDLSSRRKSSMTQIIDTMYDPVPMQEAERAASCDLDDPIAEAIKDVPPLTITIDLEGDFGTLVIDSGLEETRIIRKGPGASTLKDPIAVKKVLLAVEDTIAAIGYTELRNMGFKPQKQKRRMSRQKKAPTEAGHGNQHTRLHCG